MAHIVSIVYRPRDPQAAELPAGDAGRHDFNRVPLDKAELVAGHGLRGDLKARRNSERQVNLLSTGWLAAAAELGYRAAPGQFGEQLIVDGLDLTTLPPGTHLHLGQSAVLEIVKGRSGCARLEAAQGKSIAGLGPIGMLARVVAGGLIRVGDPVVVVEWAAAQ